MELYDAITKRRTIRDFDNIPVGDEVIERIIEAGMKAPTHDHMRDWQFIVITDKAVVLELLHEIPKGISEEDMEQLLHDWGLNDACQQACYRDAVPKQYRMLADASFVLIPLLKQKTDILHPESISHLNGFASIWCCIENIFLAATAESLTCNLRIPLGDESEWARKTLQFPEDYFMPCFIGIGHPSKEATHVKQVEHSTKDVIHKNRW